MILMKCNAFTPQEMFWHFYKKSNKSVIFGGWACNNVLLINDINIIVKVILEHEALVYRYYQCPFTFTMIGF